MNEFTAYKMMARTNSERKLILVWPLSQTGLMDMQVDEKYKLGKKIGSGMAPLIDKPAGSWQVQTWKEDWFQDGPSDQLD